MKDLVVIVIIAHKPVLSEFEMASLAQCYNVLGKYTIKLICPEGMDVSTYKKVNPKAEIEFIDPKWQSSYAMFNRLKIEPILYRKFRDYQFMLYYELDAWVFRDELEQWCKKDFDFIGAPWFEGWHNAKPDAPFVGVGNGGFSLRKIKTHLAALHRFHYIRKPAFLYSEFKKNPSFRGFFKLIGDLTIRNNTFYLFNDFDANEDYFWTHTVAPSFPEFKLPPMEEALKFSVETNPSSFIHDESELPFGCHGWWKYDTEFWVKYIPVLKTIAEKT